MTLSLPVRAFPPCLLLLFHCCVLVFTCRPRHVFFFFFFFFLFLLPFARLSQSPLFPQPTVTKVN